MEVVSADGRPITRIEPGQTRELGRGHCLDSSDRTVSRRQLSCFIPSFGDNREIRLQFEVIGQNPIYVSKDGEAKIFRMHERGEMDSGDLFCVSAKNPVWYTLRWTGNGDETVRQNVAGTEWSRSFEGIPGVLGEENFHLEGINISDIDPVKEFGFVVRGHEFDSFPTNKIFYPENWDWFLEEANKDGDDEDNELKQGKRQHRMKRKKVTEQDDEEWTGESEDDKDIVQRSTNSRRPKYITRSKDRGSKDASKSKTDARKNNRDVDEYEDEDEDEDEETLGGFIVDDETLKDEEEIGDEEEEEEELDDEEDE